MKASILAAAFLSCSLAARSILFLKDALYNLDDSKDYDAILDAKLVSDHNDKLLLRAAEKGSVEGARWLLHNGCLICDNGYSSNKDLTAIIDAAIRSGKKDLIELLFEFGCSPNTISSDVVLDLIAAGDVSLCQLLHNSGFSFKTISNKAVRTAAFRGNHEMLQFLFNIDCRLDGVADFLEISQRVHQKGDIENFNLLLSTIDIDMVFEILKKAAVTRNIYMCKHLTAYIKKEWSEDELPANFWGNVLRGADDAVKRAIISQ